MKKLFTTILSLCLAAGFVTGCGNTNDNTDTTNESPDIEATNAADSPSQQLDGASDKNILVAYFSLSDEQYEVGVIEKGNTEIIAEMIAEETGADTFKIESVTEYPKTYDELLEVSRQEADNPPQIAAEVENMEQYDIVLIGYPIWWGDIPEIVKEFLQSYDFSGKTVIPFCTHGGSGLSGTEATVQSLCPDAEIGTGLAIRGSTAQNDRDSAREDVVSWLTDSGYVK